MKKVMLVEPATGLIEPYQKLPIRFICRSKSIEKTKGFYHNYVDKTTTSSHDKSEEDKDSIEYKYTAFVTFD